MTQTSTPTPSRSPLVIPSTADAPIACDMTTAPDSASERFAEYGRLFAHALMTRERTTDGVIFKFQAKAGVADWVSDLVRREAACCPFFAYDVRFDDDVVTWNTRGDSSAPVQTFLDEFHGLPERIGEGFDGMLDRMADRGITIKTVEPGRRFTLDEQPPARSVLDKLETVCGC